MRMSCNGCRVLRKGCSASCSLRFCLQWIKSPESQANATVFLAKFYGRAGLINLIRAGPQHLRPAIFRSLLYEACGRIINPVYGSVGLLWSGRWQLCHSAVEAVLSGASLLQAPSEASAAAAAAAASTSPAAPPVKAYDIRHMSKAGTELRKVNKTRTRFKRPGARTRLTPSAVGDGEKREDECAFSAEAASHVSQREASPADQEGGEVELTLTLGAFEQAQRRPVRREPLGGTDVHSRPLLAAASAARWLDKVVTV